ncbi:MAG: Stp1/IreP family PP2C-type Ser/Thr phosphatase [Anaerolineae bacterium]
MQKPENGIYLRSSARTSTGQVRENNEDNIHLWAGDDFVLAIVADGMGGAAAGEEASRMAVETIKEGFTPREPQDGTPIAERLREIIQAANLGIFRKAAASPEMRGMGTTLTLAYVRGTYATFAHVGDSRAYLVDGMDHEITQITSDHSFVQALVLAGHITPDQVEGHPMGNVLYRALGQSEELDIDLYYKRLHVGDRLVLCSDGLTRHVKPGEIAETTFADPSPDVVSQKLIDLANERGGEDNVSVIVIAVEGDASAVFPDESTENLNPADDDDATLILADNPLRGRRDTIELSSVDIDETLRGNTPAPSLPPDDPPPANGTSHTTVEDEADARPEGRDTRLPEQ